MTKLIVIFVIGLGVGELAGIGAHRTVTRSASYPVGVCQAHGQLWLFQPPHGPVSRPVVGAPVAEGMAATQLPTCPVGSP